MFFFNFADTCDSAGLVGTIQQRLNVICKGCKRCNPCNGSRGWWHHPPRWWASATWSASAMSSACACNLSGPLIATCDRLPAQLVSGDEPDSPPNFLLLHQPGATTGKWTTGGCHQRLAPNCAVNESQGRSELQCLHDELGAPNCVVNRGWRRQPRDNLAENNREY